MNNDNCKKCFKSGIPSCLLQNINTNYSIDEIIESKERKTIEVPVCHANAQSFESDIISINSKCNNCELCKIACIHPEYNNININNNLENVLFKSLDKVNIFFKSILSKKYNVFSETKAIGNFRTKRIDITITINNNMYLVKILNNPNKIEFYNRSYNDIITTYKNKYTNYNFYTIIIISQLETQYLNNNNTLFTFTKFHSYLGDQNGYSIK